MSPPRHGRNKPKATLTGEAARHQARVERARYSYDRIVVTAEPGDQPMLSEDMPSDALLPGVPDAVYVEHYVSHSEEFDDPEAEHWGRFWGDPEGSRTEEEEA